VERVEHRLFSYISRNWRGQPLVSLAVIINLISATRTATRLRVRCELDRGTYPKGRTISDEQLALLRLTPHRFHGDLELHHSSGPPTIIHPFIVLRALNVAFSLDVALTTEG
jgi:hypothetical protein